MSSRTASPTKEANRNPPSLLIREHIAPDIRADNIIAPRENNPRFFVGSLRLFKISADNNEKRSMSKIEIAKHSINTLATPSVIEPFDLCIRKPPNQSI